MNEFATLILARLDDSDRLDRIASGQDLDLPINRAILAERERCAKIVDDYVGLSGALYERCAAEIRSGD